MSANVTWRTRKSALFFRNIIFFQQYYYVYLANLYNLDSKAVYVLLRVLICVLGPSAPAPPFFPIGTNLWDIHWQKFCANKFVCSFIFYVSSSNTFLIACYITTTTYTYYTSSLIKLFYIIHTFTSIKKNWCFPKCILSDETLLRHSADCPPLNWSQYLILEGYLGKNRLGPSGRFNYLILYTIYIT